MKTLITRDKGSEGDYRGDKKLKATREITYIYLMLDWRSPILSYETSERKAESLRTQNLTEKDIDKEVVAAFDWYKGWLIKRSRTYKTSMVMEKSLDKLDQYFEDVDFTAVDKQGKLLYSTSEYIANIGKATLAHDAVARFKAKMMEELTNKMSARNNTDLGIREEEYAFKNKKKEWSEAAPHHDDGDLQPLVSGGRDFDPDDEPEEDDEEDDDV